MASGITVVNMTRHPLVLSLLVVLVGSLILWNLTLPRHYMLRALSEVERLATGWSPSSATGPPDDTTRLYIHAARSFPGAPKDTERSVRETARRFRFVEVDIVFSKDGVPFLGHGDDLAQDAGEGYWVPSEVNAATLREMKLADGSPLLTLDELLGRYCSEFEGMLIDVKTNNDQAREKADTIVAALHTHRASNVTLLSRACVVLRLVKASEPMLPVACESYRVLSSSLAGFDAVSWDLDDVNRAEDHLARLVDLRRIYWTASTDEALVAGRRWRPDALLIDYSSGRLSDPGVSARRSGEVE